MVRAFGYCNDVFDPAAPGRLCRGRERWIDGLADTPSAQLARTVVSGAVFTDDSARDALRGVRHAGIPVAKIVRAAFPKAGLLAWCEAGDPLALPPTRLLEEDFTRSYEGGLRVAPAVRWAAPVSDADLDAWIEGEHEGLAGPKADAIVVMDEVGLSEELTTALFMLCAYGDPDDHPARLYCPSAIPDVLAHVRALLLFHLDKHGPALAIYSHEPLGIDEKLAHVARRAEAFPVPFAIPPMLARWDRALYELRLQWDSARHGDFPVPPAEDAGGRWSARRKRKERQEAEE